MPNLMNFSNYIATALANTSSNGIWIGSTQKVFGVVNGGSTSGSSGIYLVGTSANPINIKGTVVVPGDVVIQGVVTGQGTLYVGGDLYIAGNLTYANGPNFTTAPETMAAASRDAWATNTVIPAPDCNMWVMNRIWARTGLPALRTITYLSVIPMAR